MTGQDKLIDRLERVLDRSHADETEVVCSASESGLTRFANSTIHQNVAEKNNRIFFRCAIGKRVGFASTNSVVAEDLLKTLNNACEIAATLPEDPDYPGLPGPAKYKTIDTLDPATAKCTPAKRAAAVKTAIKAADKAGFTVAGSLSTGVTEVAILNSRGVRAYHAGTSAAMSVIAMSEDSSGYAAGVSPSFAGIDPAAVAGVAIEKCRLALHPQAIEPGEYEVILEPAAVGALLEWLNYVGLGSKAFAENMSFLSGNIGKKLVSDMITLYDDAYEKDGIGMPFDFEGVPRKKVVFLDKGVAKGVTHNRVSARKIGVKSTGHAIPAAWASEGAMGMNVSIAAGKTPRAKMIGQVKRGILVTRFHYINGLLDPPNAVMTGMTRDGVFLIENGAIKCGLKNLRFTDSLVRVLAKTVAVSRERTLVDNWWSSVGCTRVPALHLGSFKFTGKTEF